MPQTPHVERHFTSGETVRDIVIGMSDGLTVPFALAAGLSGAVSSTTIIITAGLAEIAAGFIAMGLGGYLAARSDKAVIERCLETELDSHLGYAKHVRKGNATGNLRNGHSQKTLKGEQGHIDIEVPRDRQGTFEPQLVKKGQTRLEGFDDKILALYARGMTTRDIQAQLQELYGVEVSPTLISNVTEAVMDEVRQWQSRPLEPVYPIIYVD